MSFINEQYELKDEDIMLIISLLSEYSKKLLNICEDIDKNRRYRLVSIIIALLSCYILYSFDYRQSFFVPSFLCLLYVFILSVNNIQQKLKLLRRDANTISFRLEKVIRVGSQTQEHVLDNFTSRIELDLRLSDAESALKHHYIDNNRKNPSLFQRILNW
jgi:hypothetical protein